jgi:hypothetical protein
VSPILRSVALALAAALLLGAAEPEDDEGTICVTVAHLWRGDARDIARIRTVPGPDSYRRLFEAGGCTRFSLIEQTLVDWHMAFGDEQTTTGALAFLEADYRKGIPAPEDFGRHLADDWEEARKAIAGAALPAAGDPTRAERERRLAKSSSVRRAAEMVAGYSRYVELAGAYARSAELYGSKRLLEKAELYFAPARAGLAVLFADGTDPNANLDHMVYAPSHDLGAVLDLEMRIPILRARLSRAPNDLDQAAAAVDRRDDPVFETAAETAREHSGNFCETDGEAQDERTRTLERACDEQSNLPRRTMEFWRNRAHLDLLMAADPKHFAPASHSRAETGSEFARRPEPVPGAKPERRIPSFEIAAWLLRNHRVGAWDERPFWSGTENLELYSLLLARSEMHSRRRPEAGDSDETGQALDFAAQAARLIPPHDSPALFARAAAAWLNLWAGAGGSEAMPYWRLGERGRFAAYLRANLATLDSIAIGEEDSEVPVR